MWSQLEICSIVAGATKKEIGRAKEFIVKKLKVEMGKSMEMGTIHAGDYLVSSHHGKLYILLYIFSYFRSDFLKHLVFLFSSETFLLQSWYEQ